jgi:phage baseplate assembly protein W
MAQQYIGITLPITNGNTGMFAQSTTVFQQVKSNFKNLILTKKGERLMQPEFGTDLHRILFENITENTLEDARLTVVEAVERWMPFLELQQFEVKNPVNGNPHRIDLSVTYRFRNNPNVTDSLTVSI